MGVFKLGKMTFGSLFKKPETVLYPIETKPQPVGLKGHIALEAESCILCGMCERNCATDCITVNKQERTWSIDRFQCIQCGYCITVCPKKCLSMNPNYAPASTQHTIDSVEVPQQEKAAKNDAPVKKDAEKSESPERGVQKQAAVQEAPIAPVVVDAVLEQKIALLEPEKAKKIRDAIAARN